MGPARAGRGSQARGRAQAPASGARSASLLISKCGSIRQRIAIGACPVPVDAWSPGLVTTSSTEEIFKGAPSARHARRCDRATRAGATIRVRVERPG